MDVQKISTELFVGNLILKEFELICFNTGFAIVSILLNGFCYCYFALIIQFTINRFASKQWSYYSYCCLSLLILFNIINSIAHCQNVPNIAIYYE